LLLTGEVFGDGSGDDASGQSAALLLQLGDAVARTLDLRLGLALLVAELDAVALPDCLLQLFGKPDRLVVLLNGPLDVLGREVGQAAVGPPLVTADAEEVQALPLGVGEAKAIVTVCTDNS
jgi:hypothetical protein